LSALGLRPRRGLSQSFLHDERVAAAIVRAAHLLPQDEVLEVGPGLGVLTSRLLRAARRVVAVELDTQLAAALSVEFTAARLEVRNQDILAFDPATAFGQPYVVVANLPYHITSPALRHLLASGPPFARRLVVMLQAEVAERLVAAAGDLSSLGVAVQVQAKVKRILRVPASAFYPRPRVDSAVIALEPHEDEARAIPRGEHADFVRFVQAGFKQPRKQLGNSLSEGLEAPKSSALALLHRAGIEPGRRPQELAVAEWVQLFRTWQAS
jgi:16S rRNA (adenine1518-N6/adenine1519-N6)-dimethyltransferase